MLKLFRERKEQNREQSKNLALVNLKKFTLFNDYLSNVL